MIAPKTDIAPKPFGYFHHSLIHRSQQMHLYNAVSQLEQLKYVCFHSFGIENSQKTTIRAFLN